MTMRRALGRVAVSLALGLFAALPAPAADAAADVAAARALFESNLDAIRRRDREAYLACYLQSPSLVRTGPSGFALGYDDVARTAGEGWPDAFDAQDLRLVSLQPGVVYGTYRYRVRYLDAEGGDDEQIGLSERLFVATPAGWKIAASTAFPAPPGTAPPPRALVGATLVDGTGRPPIADAVVVTRGGKIECAGKRADCAVPPEAGVVELGGAWVLPGLVDAHVHFSQTGWADGRPDALDVRAAHPYSEVEKEQRLHPERYWRSHLCSGVTAVFDVGGYPWTTDLPARAERDSRAPRVEAAGPLLSTLDFWLNLPAERQFIYVKDEAAARDGVRYLKSLNARAAKVWFISAERPFAEMESVVAAAGDEAKKAGLPLIVHATELANAKAALRAGAKLLVHSVRDAPVDDEFIALAKAGDAIYCPTLTVFAGYVRMFTAAAAGEVPAIDDPNGCVDATTRQRVAETAGLGSQVPPEFAARAGRANAMAEVMARNLRRVRDAGIPIAMGTDAGNPLTLHGPAVYAEMEAMQAAGMTPMQVLVAATRDAARAMGRAKDLGTIEPGKAADLIVVSADPTADVRNVRQLEYVMRGGELRSQEELRAVARRPVAAEKEPTR